MANAEMIRPFVEREIAQLLGVPEVARDEDGDIPIVNGSSVTFVRVVDGPTGAMIRFVSPVLKDVEASPGLLVHLNQLNSRTPYVRFYWSDGHVFCTMEIAGDEVQWQEIGNALAAVTGHADHTDDLLQREFGGTTMMSREEAPKPGGVGGYL